MYTRELIDDILSRADIVDVISSYIPVQQKSKGFVAICPFHNDKHPSLSISREKQIYKCFSCGAGGNAITFIKEFEKISYEEAVRKLADIIGYKDERLTTQAHKVEINPNIKPLYDCINDLTIYYQYCLGIEEGERALKYLEKRGIGSEEIRKFKIGYAPFDGERTIKYLQAKGHSLKTIEEIGITLVRASGTKDNNSGRLMFPLLNNNGQVVGFSARKIDTDVKDDSPKYINSPETKIFHKSEVLYNYYNARNTARHDGYIYVLEGFMDVISLNRAGINSAVAIMGTNLSNEHISSLRKLNAEIRLCLDGDYAGQHGMMNMIKGLYASHIPFRIVDNKGDSRDPDDIYKDEGKDGLIARMNNLVDPFDFQLSYYERVRPLNTKDDQKKAFYYFVPYLRNIEPGIDRENYVVKLSKITGYETQVINKEINRISSNKEEYTVETAIAKSETVNNSSSTDKFIKRLVLAERETLYYMLKNEEAIKYFEQNIDNFYIDVHQEIANYILDYYNSRKAPIEINLLLSDIDRNQRENYNEIKKDIMEIIESDLYPPCSNEQLLWCAETIREEKNKLYIHNKVHSSLQGKNEQERLEIISQFAKLKKNKLQKNKK